mmetsp:Transcript_26149/g.55348  ORF Transcript_26149/g.55348 Transcript_26149/m.55348 type:complete len:1116 (+) Transcript_26149:127-3474(+)
MNAVVNMTDSTSAIDNVAIIKGVSEFLWTTRTELFLFCTAVAAYMLLFGNAHPKTTRGKGKSKAKQFKEDEDETPPKAARRRAQASEGAGIEEPQRAFEQAFANSDHREALRCWGVLKMLDSVPPTCLVHAVESMQRFKKDTSYILRELKFFFKKHPAECEISSVNQLLDALGRRMDSELVEQILEMVPSLGLQPDQRTYEIQLSMQFMSRNFLEVKRLVAEMKEKQVPLTTRATIVVIKTALKTNNFEEAMRHFSSLQAIWAEQGGEVATASMAPRHIISQLVDLACKDHQLGEFLPLLAGVPLTDDVIGAMLTETIRQKDLELARRVEALAREQQIPFSDATYGLLVTGLSGDPSKVQQLFSEVVAKGTTLTNDFAHAMLTFCSQTGSISLADKLFEYMQPKQLPVLSGFIRFYAENEQNEKACDVYANHLCKLQAQEGSPASFFLDSRLERCLMNAALACGRHELAKNFLDSSPSDVAKHIAMIRNCASSNNLQGAMSVFESLQKNGVEINRVVYNTVLDACVECRDLKAAEAWMQTTKKAGLADVVSYNTLIKAHLHEENFDKARALMEEMRTEGLQPNRVTFNELVNGMVIKGSQAQRAEIWGIIKEMKVLGVKPNQVTCSILLKNLGPYSSGTDVSETMELINEMDEPMDEVLLSSVVEACVRIGKPDLLAAQLKHLQGSEGITVNGSHTFGSLIKAYGHAKDIDGVWRCWKEMRSRHIKPTSITLGCMIEAVVNNGDTEGAYELIHQMQDDEQCADALNSVIYCSVLKGFTREKRIQRVWSVYEEMLKRNVDLSIVTYNTLTDACARCGRMDRVPQIIEDMKSASIKPNLITYSTMIKGYCQIGDTQQGFNIFEQMKKETKLKPDEIMFNSLLDGCAQNNLVDEGLKLLERMQREGVQPSNFTLSLLVKLMNRAHKLDSAFSLVQEISRKYRFRPNVHVYTNLIQACIANRQLPRAMSTFEEMVRERVQPDNRTYTLLVRANMSAGLCEQAVCLLRSGLGLPNGMPGVAQSVAECWNLDSAMVCEVLKGFAERGSVQDMAVSLISDIKRLKPKVRIDPMTQRKVMSAGMSQDAGGKCERSWISESAAPQQKRNGKGGGKGGARSGRPQ